MLGVRYISIFVRKALQWRWGRGGGRSCHKKIWNSGRLSNFEADELSWTVNKWCARILRVPSSCSFIAHIQRWTLWKNHPSSVFSSKMQHNPHTQKYTHKWQDNGN